MTAYADRKNKFNAIAEAMNAPCRWPSCPCYAKQRDWLTTTAEMADPAMPCPTQAEMDAVLVQTYTMLACIGCRCRDLQERQAASDAMLHPVFGEFDEALARLCVDAYEATPDANVVNLRGGRKQ